MWIVCGNAQTPKDVRPMRDRSETASPKIKLSFEDGENGLGPFVKSSPRFQLTVSLWLIRSTTIMITPTIIIIPCMKSESAVAKYPPKNKYTAVISAKIIITIQPGIP